MSFKCRPDCSACCGPISFPKDFYEQHKKHSFKEPVELIDLAEEVYPRTDDGLCVFLNRELHRCQIYDVRPEICRIYGTGVNEDLLCPFLKPNGKPRSEASRKQVERKLKNLYNTTKKRFSK